MEYWKLALFGGAAYLAFQSLVSLMAQHKRRHLAKLINAENERRRAAPKEATAAGENEKPPDDAASNDAA